ncbi:GNAT family N-acetyltransferase [Herbiconiux sp. SYSU D00978]|uniref:GNAT family N-acetyltransferase n=1 Tax=Herbiconiux sp. SYSU D00978 TaxID=2812562 RepID=UPI001A963FA6|nr:GNAT family N-acetyltransferase [Herbiconiux sp. SYSU D00978]
MVSWREARTTDDSALALLGEYFAALSAAFGGDGFRPSFPDPAEFVPPEGVFLVVESEDLAGEPADVGCGGIRSLGTSREGLRRFEVKHLFLQPHVRGMGFGRALLAELERRGRDLGAEELVLDTNSTLEAAGGLYRSAGFVPVPAYNDNPDATDWYAKRLS